MYIKEVWLATNPSNDELETALQRFRLLVTTNPTLSKYYLCDVVRVMCHIQHAINLSKTFDLLPLPSVTNYNPQIANTDSDRCINLILRPAVNHDAVSYYMYIETLKTFSNKITYNTAKSKAVSATRLQKLMTRFSSECKFKKTADLFIWVILFLKIPPWLTCALANDERPYALVTRCHGADTNPLVQPLIKESVEDLLALSTGYEQFCILAALALELTDTSSGIAFNKQLLHKDPRIPTFAVVREPFTSKAGIKHEFGYIHNHVFNVFANPYEAVSAWALAVSDASAFSEVCCDETELSFDNAFVKFLK